MELLTRKEAADYLRLSLRKLDALAASGEIRRAKFGEGQRARVLFRRQDLDDFITASLSASRLDIERRAAAILQGARN